MRWIVARSSLLLALACLCAKSQARVTIGYRVTEAESINEKNYPCRDEMYDSETGNQIGNGVHLVAEPAGWMEIPFRPNWHCVFKADEDKLQAATKLWIPRTWNGDKLWWTRDSNVRRYISQYGDPDQTLRFSYIDQWEDGRTLQMVIPTEMVNRDTLDIFAKCFPSKEELLAYEDERVRWLSWNMIGLS
ncbi:hypothetical protein C8034_v001471 [Colletotrichum sidae]|uniref:Uncharacterized protein n=1 Tax=Colletotrichum sidae TaxID=1347389 RepID=A0A4R8TCN8_9PEZI|nr:hypothetical protein C8034_v001471 [Colletotrichum sidae]